MTYQDRINSLQKRLVKENCPNLLVEDKTNLFYLTGLELSAGVLLVDQTGGHLFVDNRYLELCKKQSLVPVHLVESVIMDELFSKEPFQSVKELGFDSTRTTHKSFLELQAVASRLNINLIPLNDPICHLRMIKDSSEITLLKEAGVLGSLGFDFVVSILREGISEEEVAQELEIFWKRRGSKSIAFDPIIAFGPNSSMPHYRAGKTLLKRGDCVLIDIGVNYRHYHSDMTRVVFFGEPDPRISNIFTIVKDAQQAALNLCRPGSLIGELDKAARDHIASCGFEEFFTHSLGHGVGLDIHEAPWVRGKSPHAEVPLEIGMVITIEPGIYLPGIGGVRIEDCIAITQTGYDNMTNRDVEPTILS